MSRSINELTLQEHRTLANYVDAIARRDVRVVLGVADMETARQSLRREFDTRLRAASAGQLSRTEAFRSALLDL